MRTFGNSTARNEKNEERKHAHDIGHLGVIVVGIIQTLEDCLLLLRTMGHHWWLARLAAMSLAGVPLDDVHEPGQPYTLVHPGQGKGF